MTSYFTEIIFFPGVKKIIPQSSKCDFWFVTVVDIITRESYTNMMAACPNCDTSFIVRSDIADEQMIKDSLRLNALYFFNYVLEHCPKCNERYDHD